MNRLPDQIRWLPHNLIGHPLMAIFHVFGLVELGNKLHDLTLPAN